MDFARNPRTASQGLSALSEPLPECISLRAKASHTDRHREREKEGAMGGPTQTTRRLSKGEITHNIECRKTVPSHHVLRSTFTRPAQLGRQLPRIQLEEALLLAECSLRESGQNCPSQLRVLLLVCRRDASHPHSRWRNDAASIKALDKLWVALPVDFLPGGAGRVGEFIGRDANHRPVLLVEIADLPGDVPAKTGQDPREAREGPDFGARVCGKWVEKETVDCPYNPIQTDLQKEVRTYTDIKMFGRRHRGEEALTYRAE